MNEHATREEMRAEAIERIKMLDLHPNVLRDLRDDGRINISERVGLLFWADDSDLELIRNIEEEYEIFVYHGIKTTATFGRMLTLFYVSKYKNEWEMAREDFKYNESCCYVHNYDEPCFSEFGTIGFEPKIGGLIRTA